MIAALVTAFLSLGGSPARGVSGGLFEGTVIAFALILAAITAAAGIFYLHSGIPAHQHGGKLLQETSGGKLLQQSSAPLLIAVSLLAAMSVASRVPDSIFRPARTVAVLAIFCVVGEVVGVGLPGLVSLPLSWTLVVVAVLLAFARAAAFGIDRLLKRLTERPSKPLSQPMRWLARQLFVSLPSRRNRSPTFHVEVQLASESVLIEVYAEQWLTNRAVPGQRSYDWIWFARPIGRLDWQTSIKTPHGAISRAVALPAKQSPAPAWLDQAVNDVLRSIFPKPEPALRRSP